MAIMLSNYCYWLIVFSFSLQIFFHYSELSKNAESELEIGSSVEFTVQNRQVRKAK